MRGKQVYTTSKIYTNRFFSYYKKSIQKILQKIVWDGNFTSIIYYIPSIGVYSIYRYIDTYYL